MCADYPIYEPLQESLSFITGGIAFQVAFIFATVAHQLCLFPPPVIDPAWAVMDCVMPIWCGSKLLTQAPGAAFWTNQLSYPR